MPSQEFIRKLANYPCIDFEDVLIKPCPNTYTSRKEANIKRKFTNFPYGKYDFEAVPIITSNMYVTGTKEMASVMAAHDMMTCLHKFHSDEELTEIYKNSDLKRYVFYSMGMRKEEYEKFNRLKKRLDIDKVSIEVANGYMRCFVDYVKRIRDENPDIVIMAGNVCTAEGCEDLFYAGADIIRVGIGNGKCCTTRNVAGVGVPQLSALLECCKVAQRLKFYICSDGGIREIADFSKAFVAGADLVMVGSFFAGYDQSGGDIIEMTIDGKNVRMKEVYGMASYKAMEKHYKEILDYKAAEGKDFYQPVKGDISHLLKEVKGGIRSCMTYIDAKTIDEMKYKGDFVLVKRIKS